MILFSFDVVYRRIKLTDREYRENVDIIFCSFLSQSAQEIDYKKC